MGMTLIGSILTPLARYVESHESGAASDVIEAGVRTRTVTAVYHCLKAEARTVAGAIPALPAALHTTGGRNPDGTWAPSVNWGAGFELSGITVGPASPYLARLEARYTATDPAGGDGTAPAGSPAGALLGKPWEGGLRYVETPASGKCQDDRVYLKDSFGWNRARTVDLSLICLKTDSRTIMDGLSLAPASLTTNPHSGASVAWGRAFSLVSIDGASLSPSFYAITAKYRRNVAEAVFAPPAGVSLACAAGICTLTWDGVLFEEMDSGVPTSAEGIDVELDPADPYTIRLTCCGTVMEDFKPTATTGDRILEWQIDGQTANLLWCGAVWKSYTAGA